VSIGRRLFCKLAAYSEGIETPPREDLARLDRQRAEKGSKREWVNPNDPDAEMLTFRCL